MFSSGAAAGMSGTGGGRSGMGIGCSIGEISFSIMFWISLFINWISCALK